jgi:Cys-tRNA(Pro)/Cys-tRNA(Cys) deacylase
MPRKPQRKTNTMRLLDAQGIRYVVHSFSPEIHSAQGVAEVVGVAPDRVFKTLVVTSAVGGPPLLALVGADRELDLKKLANAAEEKKLRMATHREAETLTGLLIGGISPLALLHKSWRVFLDVSANDQPELLVSAGKRGINLQLAVSDLVRLTEARVCDLSRPIAEP